MSTYAERRLPPGSKFLKQEAARERGKNTCYVTSAVNAAIALGVIGIPKAIQAHERIVEELARLRYLWDGSLLIVDSRDQTIPRAIERHIPNIYLGFKPENWPGMIYKEACNFEAIQNRLAGGHTFVALVRRQAHAYAITKDYDGILEYVDPLNPGVRLLTAPNQFTNRLDPQKTGLLEVTLVSRK